MSSAAQARLRKERKSRRSSRVSGVCRITPAVKKRLSHDYTALHEGLQPRSIACRPVVYDDKEPRAFGQATEIQYIKPIPGQKPDYHHPWKLYAQPTIGVDANGRLHFKAGRYEVRRRGIEDRVPDGKKGSPYLVIRHVRKERWLDKAPRHLTGLGKLRFIRYTSMGQSGPRVMTLRFAPGSAPDLAHDQDGNLVALGGRRISIPSLTGAVPTMARRRHRHSRHVRSNPTNDYSRRRPSSETPIEQSGMLALTGLGVLALSVPTAVIVDGLLAQTNWSAGAKALTKLAVGVGGFGTIATFMPQSSKLRPALAIGVLAGAGGEAARDLYNLYAAPYVAQLTAPAAPVTPALPATAPVAGVIAPGSQALMPGGAPAGYRAYNPQACAVG